MCWIRRLCSRNIGTVFSVRKCLSVCSLDCRSSESCLLNKVLDIDVTCVYVPYKRYRYVPCVFIVTVLNKIFWGRLLNQGEKSLQPSRQPHLEDGKGVSPSDFWRTSTHSRLSAREGFTEFCHHESLKI